MAGDVVRALLDHDGRPLVSAIVAGRLYQQDAPLDQLCVPLPLDATCALCAGYDCHDDACGRA